MKLFNTTYHDNDDIKLMDELVGKPFSFITAIQMGGVGSKRLMIANASPEFNDVLKSISDINYANIALRPQGIIVHFTQQLKRYAWVVPYYKLVIYNTATFSMYSDHVFLRFVKNKQYQENKGFIKKMMQQKITYTTKNNTYENH